MGVEIRCQFYGEWLKSSAPFSDRGSGLHLNPLFRLRVWRGGTDELGHDELGRPLSSIMRGARIAPRRIVGQNELPGKRKKYWQFRAYSNVEYTAAGGSVGGENHLWSAAGSRGPCIGRHRKPPLLREGIPGASHRSNRIGARSQYRYDEPI